jgi:hypothetical protein
MGGTLSLISLPCDHLPYQKSSFQNIIQSVPNKYFCARIPVLVLIRKFNKSHLDNKLVSILSFEDNFSVIEYHDIYSQEIYNFLSSEHIKFTEMIDSALIQCSLVHLSLWKISDHSAGHAYGYLNVMPYMHRICEIFDIKSTGEVLAAVPLQHPHLPGSERKLITFQLGFQPNDHTISCESVESRNIFGEFEFLSHNISFFYINFNPLAYEKEIFDGVFPARKQKFSYQIDPIPSLKAVLSDHSSEISSNSESEDQNKMSDFTPLSPDSSETVSDESTEGNHSSGIILSTQSQSGDENEEEVISEDSYSSEEQEDSLTSHPKTTQIWAPKHFYRSHYGAPQLEEVMELIKRKEAGHLKKIKDLIGDISKSTFYRWSRKLKKDPTYSPRKVTCGEKSKALSQELEFKILQRIEEEFHANQLLFTDAHCQEIALQEYEKVKKKLRNKKSSKHPGIGSEIFEKII